MPPLSGEAELEQPNVHPPPGDYARVSKNAGIYFLGQLLSWAAILIHMIVLPRFFGAKTTGQWTSTSTLILMALTPLMFSFEQYLTLEVSKDRARTERLLRAIYGFRLLLIPIFITICLIILKYSHADRTYFIVGLVIMSTGIASFFSSPLSAILSGYEDAKFLTILSTITSFTAIFTLFFLPFGVVAIVIAGASFSSFLVWALMAFKLRKKINLTPEFNISLWKELLVNGAPFLVNSLLLQFTGSLALVILWRFSDAANVGTYAVALKLLGSLLFIPTVITSAILPSVARLAQTNMAKLENVQRRIFVIVLIAAFGVSAETWFVGEGMINLIYKNRFPGLALAFQCTIFQIVPVFITTTLYSFLVVRNKNRVWSIFLVLTLVLNVIFCWIGIPLSIHWLRNASVGAIVASGASEMISSLFGIFLLKMNLFDRRSVLQFVRICFATALMSLVMWLLRDIFFVVPAVVGGAVFVFTIWKMKVLELEDQEKIVQLFQNKFDPIISRLKKTFLRG